MMDIVDSKFGFVDYFPLRRMHSVASHSVGMDFVGQLAVESIGRLKNWIMKIGFSFNQRTIDRKIKFKKKLLLCWYCGPPDLNTVGLWV